MAALGLFSTYSFSAQFASLIFHLTEDVNGNNVPENADSSVHVNCEAKPPRRIFILRAVAGNRLYPFTLRLW